MPHLVLPLSYGHVAVLSSNGEVKLENLELGFPSTGREPKPEKEDLEGSGRDKWGRGRSEGHLREGTGVQKGECNQENKEGVEGNICVPHKVAEKH